MDSKDVCGGLAAAKRVTIFAAAVLAEPAAVLAKPAAVSAKRRLCGQIRVRDCLPKCELAL